jgi:maleate cis-trans isomerase
MEGSAVRFPIGILYPGHSAEDDYRVLEARLGPAFVFPVHHTVMAEDAHRLDALLDWGRADRLADGARALAPLGPVAVVWACTSGSFAFGWSGAREQVARLAAVAGVPATSTSLAFVAAAQALGLRRVAVVATYPDDVAQLFAEFLSEGGISVTSLRSHGIVTDAVLLPDTALHTVGHVAALERTVRRPVLTANLVSAWAGLRLAGLRPTRPGLGALFAAGAVPEPAS